MTAIAVRLCHWNAQLPAHQLPSPPSLQQFACMPWLPVLSLPVLSLPAWLPPPRPRKRLSRWANAVMFARALSSNARTLPTSRAAAAAAAAAAVPVKGTPRAAKPTLTQRIQARVVPLIDKAATLIAGTDSITTSSSNGSASISNSGGQDSAAVLQQRSTKAGGPSAESADGQGVAEVPGDAAAAADDFQTRTAAASSARAKLKGLTQRAVEAASGSSTAH